MLLNPGSDCGCCASGLTCSPCDIPLRDLTVTWTNSIIGTGSVTMVFDGVNQWNSACTNQLLYSLTCATGAIKFSVTYFVSGSCPTGQRQSCVSPGASPQALTLASYTCSGPFQLNYTCAFADCSVLAGNGYSAFTIA